VASFRTILVPTDFSPHARVALDTAIDLAKTFGGKLHLLHAYHLPIQLAMPDQIVIPQTFWDEVRKSAEHKLDEERDRASRAGVQATTELVPDSPAVAAVEVARRIGADLIVMGTRGLTGVKHVLLGSVAERTIRTAPCPVLTVKHAEH
jgi:nucleotide-binding universal stress UspA family protein